jgi:hypothetical protein
MTKATRKLIARSSNFLRRMLRKPAWQFTRFIDDPRQQKGRRWKFKTLMEALFFGFLTNRGSLRDVETMTEFSGSALLGPLFHGRVPDTTLYDLVGKCSAQEVDGLRTQLHAQTHSLWRSKSIDPVGLPCGVAAVDNKTLWTGKPEEAHDPECQLVHPKNRAAYAQLRCVRTVLISAASKPTVDQVVMRRQTNERGMFAEVFAVLCEQYDSLIEVYSMDAGFCSEANARKVDEAQKGYIFGLKENQPELYREAVRVVGSAGAEVRTQWERYQGDRIRYHLYRTCEMAGYLGWDHLKQVWRVEKEIVSGRTGESTRENRYYVTNLHVGRLTPRQILQVIRAHWGIENNCNWTLDVVWDEDTKAWCGQGLGIRVLGLLRLMAYNLVSSLRLRYLRKRGEAGEEKRRWKEICDLIFLAITREGIDLAGIKRMPHGR